MEDFFLKKWKLLRAWFFLRGVERKNALFHAMSPARQRVAIARDVIQQLAIDKYHPASVYCSVDADYDRIDYDRINYSTGVKLQAVLVVDNPKCVVCGIGSLAVSALRLGDKYEGTIKDLSSFWDVHRFLSQYFDKADIGFIEVAFEGVAASGSNRAYYDNYEKYKDCQAFYSHHMNGSRDDATPYRTATMRAIMYNIIANNGRFVPPPAESYNKAEKVETVNSQ